MLKTTYGKLKIKTFQCLNSYLTFWFLQQNNDWFHPWLHSHRSGQRK